MSLKTPHMISGVQTLDAYMTGEAVRRSTNAPRPLLNEGGGGKKEVSRESEPRG